MPGIPEVPLTDDWPQLRRFLMDMRTNVLRLQTSQAPASSVSNLQATGIAGAIVVRFTRSDGDGYTLYWSNDANFANATPIDLGKAAEFIDDIGKSNVTRNYWVRARRFLGSPSDVMGPVKATTAATLATEVTLPAPPPKSVIQATDQTTGGTVGIDPTPGRGADIPL